MATKSKKGLIGIVICAVLLVIAIVFSIVVGVNFNKMAAANGTTKSAVTRAEATSLGKAACKNIEAEGATLLYNKNDTLPLNKASGKTKVTVLGACSHNYVQGGTGSAGGRDDSDTVMIADAFENAGIDYNAAAWEWLTNALGDGDDVHNGGVDTDYLADVDAGVVDRFDWTAYREVHELSKATYEEFVTASVIGEYKTAVVTFGRSGAEGASPSLDYDGNGDTTTGRHYLELTENEKNLLTFCKTNFDNTVVLINSAVPMECGFVTNSAYNIGAAVWIGHPGESGMEGVAEILAGNVNPSGHLVDTWSYDMSTNPTFWSANDQTYTNINSDDTGRKYYEYNEGVYVGYRYYETADAEGYFDSADFKAIKYKGNMSEGKYTEGTDYAAMKTAGPQISYAGYDEVVQYPFGYGLSYTTFTQTIKSANISMTPGGTNEIVVTVKNTGAVAGKDVVQLYLESPYDQSKFGITGVGLEQAKVSLIGFGKTDKLEPNAEQDITISFNTDDLATYDEFGQGCYVLADGKYTFHVSPNAHGWAGDAAYGADYATAEHTLASPVIYKAKPASGTVTGAQYVEKRQGEMNGVTAVEGQSAVNRMNDITAGDGAMLINGGASGTYKYGYLSRKDFGAGMKEIMSYQSDDLTGKYSGNGKVFGTDTALKNGALSADGTTCRRVTSDAVKAQIEAKPGDVSDAGIKGESGTVGVVGKLYKYGDQLAEGITFGDGNTEKYLYGYGNDGISTMKYTRDGLTQDDASYDVLFDRTYYVAIDGDGNKVLADDGYVAIFDTQAAAAEKGAAELLQATHMDGVPTSDLTRWTKLTNMLSFTEADGLMGDNGWKSAAADSIGKPQQLAVDGPGEAGNAQNAGCTWWPCAVIIAATWNPECAEKDYGVNYGYQDLLNNVPYCYAPAMNTHRTPFGGRDFEYYSEDGFIAGVIGGYAVQGLQSVGMHVFIKHYALNDSDTNRGGVCTWADEMSMRMIYAKPYEIACKYFEADGIMGSLNRMGMAWAHTGFYNDMTRDEWNWIGMMITDGDGSNKDQYNQYDFWNFCNYAGLLGGGKLSTHTSYVNVGTNGENATKYQKYVIHTIARNAVYQYSHNIDSIEIEPNGTVPTVLLCVVDGVLLVAITIVALAVVLPAFRKKQRD